MTREEIGQFILAARKRQKLSQKELAKRAGITRYQQILEIEKAQFEYSFTMLNKVITGLGLEVVINDPTWEKRVNAEVNDPPKKLNGHRVYDFSKVNSLKEENKNVNRKIKKYVKN